MNIFKHTNSFINSNTYLLSIPNVNYAWIIDPGDSEFIFNWLDNNKKELLGILVTHSHIDHIYGINDIVVKYPNVAIYASKECIIGMQSSRNNLSEYHEIPYIVNNSKNINPISDGDKINLWPDIFVSVIYTPGHNFESMSFLIKDNLFTGDALIPGIKVFTKFKGGNKSIAKKTIDSIFKNFNLEINIWPGHFDSCKLKDLIDIKDNLV